MTRDVINTLGRPEEPGWMDGSRISTTTQSTVRQVFTDVFPGHVHPIHASPALSSANRYVSHMLGHVWTCFSQVSFLLPRQGLDC